MHDICATIMKQLSKLVIFLLVYSYLYMYEERERCTYIERYNWNHYGFDVDPKDMHY